MRLVPVNQLREGSKIAVNIIDNEGRFLLKEGKGITLNGIKTLENIGVNYVYIKDEYCFNAGSRKYSEEVERIFGHILELQQIAVKTIEGKAGQEELSGVREISAQIVDEMLELPEDLKIVYEPSKLIVNPIIEESIYVAMMSVALGIKMGLDRKSLIELCLAALLKDVALLSPSVETDNVSYRKHPYMGYEYLKEAYALEENILNAVLQHHELFDGSGYPNGISGREICDFARIIGLVSCFYEVKSTHNELTSSESLLEGKLKNILKRFDAEMITCFIRNAEVFMLDTIVRLNNDDLAVIYANNSNNPFRPTVRIVRSLRYEEGEIISLQENTSLAIKGIEYYV